MSDDTAWPVITRPQWTRPEREPPAPEPRPRTRELEARLAKVEARVGVLEHTLRLLTAAIKRKTGNA